MKPHDVEIIEIGLAALDCHSGKVHSAQPALMLVLVSMHMSVHRSTRMPALMPTHGCARMPAHKVCSTKQIYCRPSHSTVTAFCTEVCTCPFIRVRASQSDTGHILATNAVPMLVIDAAF